MTDDAPEETDEYERSPEERLKAVLRRDDINEKTRHVAERALIARQEGRL